PPAVADEIHTNLADDAIANGLRALEVPHRIVALALQAPDIPLQIQVECERSDHPEDPDAKVEPGGQETLERLPVYGAEAARGGERRAGERLRLLPTPPNSVS